MDCVKCGAPLAAKSNLCGYCGALNDTDLRAIHRDAKLGPATDRYCPRCEAPMQSIDLQLEGEFFIERCENCLGIFFDPGELECIIDKSVSNIYAVDYRRMAKIIEEEGVERPSTVKYVKCPVCRKLMNRRNYGSRSGVVVDTCTEHGVWLDGGELGQLLKWTKAGGRIRADKAKAAEQREAELRSRHAHADRIESYTYACDTESNLEDFVTVRGLGFLVGTVIRLLR